MLRMDRGHVLLIGSNGNGKKSLSKLAAFTSGNVNPRYGLVLKYFIAIRFFFIFNVNRDRDQMFYVINQFNQD